MLEGLQKLANMIDNNYKKDMRKKIDEEYLKEFEKNFDSFFEPRYREAMNEAIDTFYSHPPGKLYERTGQFSGGKGLYNIYITDGGRAIMVSEGEGFPSYPAVKTKKWSRKHPWPGDLAWKALFAEGLHGTGLRNIGTTSPPPYEIVEKKLQEAADEYVDMIRDIIQEKVVQIQQAILNTYMRSCI